MKGLVQFTANKRDYYWINVRGDLKNPDGQDRFKDLFRLDKALLHEKNSVEGNSYFKTHTLVVPLELL